MTSIHQSPYPKTSLIILSFNGLSFTEGCVKSIEEKDDRYDEILIVDNGSSPEVIKGLKELEKRNSRVQLILLGKNYGYTRANNIAIDKAKKENDIILLNNDIEILTPDWIEKLQEDAYSLNDLGVLGCRLIDQFERLLHVGAVLFDDNFRGYQIGSLTEVDINQYNLLHQEESVVFAAVYIKREVINKIGALDEDFFAYYEDTDFCLRAMKNGYKTYCSGKVTIIHFENTTTKINNLNFNKMYEKSRDTFLSKWKRDLTTFDTAVNWRSLINFKSGYANSSINIMKELRKQHVNVGYNYIYGPGTPFPVNEAPSTDRFTAYFQNKGLVNTPVEVAYGQGDVFFRNTGKYKVGFTMLEVTGIPSDWASQANKMDEVWVPSQFNVETFTNSGVKVPIKVMPLGVDINYFNPDILPVSLFPGRFKFLSCFEWGERKAPEILLKAFDEEFGQNKSALLICKVNNFDASIDVKQEIEKMNLKNGGKNIIILNNQLLPSYQMGCLYRSCDAFVLTTRGEGWGLPIMEAMACGVPAIATHWSSQVDFMDESTTYPVKISGLVPAEAKCPYYEGFKWSEPDYEHLKFQMRQVFKHQVEAKQKATKAVEYVQQNFSLEHVGRRIKERIIQIHHSL